MKELNINLKDNSYKIIIENNLLFHLSFYIESVYKGKKIYIITDDIVADLYLDTAMKALSQFEVDYVIIPNGEKSKSLDTYASVCQQLLDKNIRRNNLLIALGGGVVGDLTGFVASTLFRGIPYIGIPTTLLSQMDSSIGGKTGIDFNGRKNILGAFKQPLMVLIDPYVLKTLDKREFNNGMGELIKHAVIGDSYLFDLLMNKPDIDETIIYESLKVKKGFVEKDEFDLNERMMLNFGHTFGHAIELEKGFKHGEAVSIGMLMAIKMGIDLNITKPICYESLRTILELYGLPCIEYNYKEYLNLVVYDKKNLAGNIKFILIKNIGEVLIYPINEDDIKGLI